MTTDTDPPVRKLSKAAKIGLIVTLVLIVFAAAWWVVSRKGPAVESVQETVQAGQIVVLGPTRGYRIAELEPVKLDDGVLRFGDGCFGRSESSIEVVGTEGDAVLLRYHRSRDRGKNYTVRYDPHGIFPKWDGECPDKALLLSDKQDVIEARKEARIHAKPDDERRESVRKILEIKRSGR